MAISPEAFSLFCYAWLGLAAAVFILMFFITAPFGRHTKSTWGPVANERLAWALMELPSFAVMAVALMVFPFNLRKRGETGYTLPRGFLFEYVASPNLLGEIIEWGGFALLAWNLPALCFFAWTCANLISRAKNHWDWSRAHFLDYPKKRRILIPF